MKIIKKISRLFILIVTYFIVGNLFNGNHTWISFFVIIVAIVTSSYFLKKENIEVISNFIFLILPLFIFLLIISLFAGFSRTFVYLIFLPIAYFFSYVIRNKSWLKIFLLGLIFTLLVSFLILPNYQNFILNRNSSRNITFKQIKLIDKNCNVVNFDKNKIIVLDFWNTSCGVCFKKFPEFEKFSKNFENESNIEFYSVNIPLERDKFSDVVNMVSKLNYDFKTIYATSVSEAANNLDVQVYPTILIIKNNKIKFSGYLNIDEVILLYNTNNILNNLLIN